MYNNIIISKIESYDIRITNSLTLKFVNMHLTLIASFIKIKHYILCYFFILMSSLTFKLIRVGQYHTESKLSKDSNEISDRILIYFYILTNNQTQGIHYSFHKCLL